VARPNPRPGFAFLFIAAIVRPIMAVLCKRDWRGKENLPATGGALIVANHYSFFDPISVGHFVVANGRTPRFTAKTGVFKNPVLGRLFKAAGQIPVERGSREAVKALLAAQDAVKSGETVIFYPEGTMTKDPELWPMAGRTGAARIALRTGAPVIPVAQWGAQEVFAPYSTKPQFFPRKTLKVVAGPPLDLSQWAGRQRDRGAEQEVTELIMAEITKLLEGLRGEKAPEVRFVPPPKEVAAERAQEPAESVETAQGAGAARQETAESVESVQTPESVQTAEPVESVQSAESVESVAGAVPAETAGAKPVAGVGE
jgi:1-acyl-sn-glycerol-3-phosphate acyltransferase